MNVCSMGMRRGVYANNIQWMCCGCVVCMFVDVFIFSARDEHLSKTQCKWFTAMSMPANVSTPIWISFTRLMLPNNASNRTTTLACWHSYSRAGLEAFQPTHRMWLPPRARAHFDMQAPYFTKKWCVSGGGVGRGLLNTSWG